MGTPVGGLEVASPVRVPWIKKGFEPKSQDSDTESNQSAKSHRSSSDRTKGKPHGKGAFDKGKHKGKPKGKHKGKSKDKSKGKSKGKKGGASHQGD